MNPIEQAAKAINNAQHIIAFTGAGISVESGIPPFRGEGGLWGKYNPQILDLDYFFAHPKKSWEVIREIFYAFFGEAKPNAAHLLLARLEKERKLKAVITQNIDGLHTMAGSQNVQEFHGTAQQLVCTKCWHRQAASKTDLTELPPKCESCGELLKPDFIFFGENITPHIHEASFKQAEACDLVIIIGASGEVMPAAQIPQIAQQNGATVIEISTEETLFTPKTTTFFIKGKAAEQSVLLEKAIFVKIDTK